MKNLILEWTGIITIGSLIAFGVHSCDRTLERKFPTTDAEHSTVKEYSDEQIVNAIYKAEGGDQATYLYGIRSVPYDTPQEARKICFNTVRNNRKRYADYGHAKFDTYLEFLQSRYCPTEGKGLTKNEKRLNINWLGNVRYFLEKETHANRNK